MIKKNKIKIWIDMDNSPHVVFFNHIIRELEKNGYEVVVTVRDCFQVCGLADLFNIDYNKVGVHYGKNKILKILGTIIRSLQLIPTVMKEKPNLAISHGARAQLITAWLSRIPSLVLFDYEYVQTTGFIKANWVMGPEVITKKYPNNNILSYRGLKEDVYVPYYNPNSCFLEELNINKDLILATLRPPATEAHYHNHESEILFENVIEHLAIHDNVQMVILPRNEKKQTLWIINKWYNLYKQNKIIIPDNVINGLDLIWYSDFVISGGGTMNREAASLGVPVYSIFKGKLGAVDKYLSNEGRLIFINDKEDIINKINIIKRNKTNKINKKEKSALKDIICKINEIVSLK